MPNSINRPMIDRISIVLRPADGQTLEQITPFVQLGAHVSIGRGLAVIAGASDRDVVTPAMDATEQQDSPQNIPGLIPGPWTDVQCLDFCSVALRHMVVEGDLQLRDINDALRYMADKYKVQPVDSMHIDDRVRMTANAKRYEWLRDRNRVSDIDTCLCVAHDNTVYFGHDLDKNVDDAMRSARLEELHSCAD